VLTSRITEGEEKIILGHHYGDQCFGLVGLLTLTLLTLDYVWLLYLSY